MGSICTTCKAIIESKEIQDLCHNTEVEVEKEIIIELNKILDCGCCEAKSNTTNKENDDLK
jgi:hypothetical protein